VCYRRDQGGRRIEGRLARREITSVLGGHTHRRRVGSCRVGSCAESGVRESSGGRSDVEGRKDAESELPHSTAKGTKDRKRED
jgi:hypothetical protein